MSIDFSRFPHSGDILGPDGRTMGAYTSDPIRQRPQPVGSAEWWRDRLLARLITRAAICREFYEFYDGQQPLAFASSKFVETYGRRFGRFPANFMPLVIDAERERLVVAGFRFGRDPEAANRIV